MQSTRPLLQALTSLRFLAALWVFLFHMLSFPQHPRWGARTNQILQEGFAGVTFFFVLSGFILTYNYLQRFRVLHPGEVLRFYAARLARIYPVHLLTLLASLPLVLPLLDTDARGFYRSATLNVLLVQSFHHEMPIYWGFNAPSWSLSNEIFFYFLLPGLLWLASRLRVDRPWKTILLMVLLSATSLGIDYYCHVRQPKYWFWICYICPLKRLLEFGVGVGLGLIYCQTGPRAASAPGAARAIGVTLLEVGAIGLLGACVVLSQRVPIPMRVGGYYIPAMALVVLTIALGQGLVARVLAARPLMFLGEVSFSFYMFHMLVAHYGFETYYQLVRGMGANTVTLVLFAISLALSIVCYFLFEMPVRNLITSWLKRKPARPAPAPVAVESVRQVA